MKRDRRPAVFLDRDGTISEEVGYMTDLSKYSIFPWTSEAIRKLNEAGLVTVLVTNQSGVARGLFGSGDVDLVHDRLRHEIGRAGARLDAIYYCPHHPDDECGCRKPRPGLLYQASLEIGLDLPGSFMVGDRYTDVATGRAAGTRTILVLTGLGREQHRAYKDELRQPDFVADTLDHAVDFILASSGRLGARRF